MNRCCRIWLLLLLSAVALGSRAEERNRRFVTFDSSYGLADNSAQTIMCTKTGRIVISTIGHINFYDGTSFTHIDPTADDIFPLPGYMGHYHLYFDKFHHLWLKDKRVITCVDLMMERFVSDAGQVMRDIGFRGTAEDLFGDHDNHLWFFAEGQLVSPEYQVKLPVRKKAELQDVDVHDSTLLLQFFGDGSVTAYDLKSKKKCFDLMSPLPGDEAKEYARSSVVFYVEGTYYQIRNGEKNSVLQRLDVGKRHWKVMMKTPYHLNNLVYREGKLYISCEYGYWVYDMKTEETEHVEQLMLANGRQLLTDINAMAFDRQGGMWLGTQQRGLLYSRPYPSPFKTYSWEQPEALRYAAMMDRMPKSDEVLPRRINCMLRDSRGWTWLGAYTGLQLQKEKGELTRTFTLKDGLNNEMIHSIIEDDHHDVWVGTSYGISKLWIQGDSITLITSYDQQDNIPNESFVNGRVMKLDDGTIVMQALDHVVTFHPDALNTERIRHTVLYPKLTRLMVNGRVIAPGVSYDGHVILDRAITRAKEINVNYNQNSLSLNFSGLNFWRPVQTFYRLRVKGIYDEWRVFSKANAGGMVDKNGIFHLPLTGLEPGEYHIELQASMTPDTWEAKPFVWIVTVNQPWWRSTGVYILLLVVLAVLLLGNFLLFNRNTYLRLRRYQEESDMLKRILNYAHRCNSQSGDILTPYMQTETEDGKGEGMNQEFTDLMMKVVTYINTHADQKLTMDRLAEMTGMELKKIYDLMAANLYKSPHQIVASLRLKQAADLLLSTESSIDDVAEQCGFVSPNFFIASFYHQYRMTPLDYRKTAPR